MTEADIADLIGDEPAPPVQFTAREEGFISEYLVDMCQWKALMRSENGQPGDKHWRELAYALMKRPHVKAEVKRRLAVMFDQLGEDAMSVKREIARMAMFDPAHVTGVESPDDIAQLPEDVRRAIVGWSWDKRGNFIIKLAKEGALEMLGRHLGLFEKDKPQIGVQVTIHATPHDEKL